jgi:hypothetical protein
MFARNSSGTEPVMTRRTRPELTAEQQVEAQRLRELMLEAAAADLTELAELLATKTDATMLGETEFHVRDLVHRVGAKAIETALAERKKGGTQGRASPVPSAANRLGSSAGETSR